MNVPEELWPSNGSDARRVEFDQDAARYGERPGAEDRKQEAGHRHVLARRSGPLAK